MKRIILAVVLVVILAVGGWSYYQVETYEPTHIEYSIDIDQDREIVWHYLTDLGYRKLWMPHLESLTAISGIPFTVGEETLVTLYIDDVPYEYIERTVAIDPPTFLLMELEADGFTGQLEYDLRETDGGTQLNVTRDVRYTTLTGVILSPFLKEREREDLFAGMQKLRRLAETAPEETVPDM